MFFFMVWSGQNVLKSLRVQVFEHINRLSIGYHVEHEAGDTMSRVTNDADTIQQGMTFALVQVLSGAMLIIWVAYNMLASSVPYALIALAIVPLMGFATSWFSTQARRAFRRTRLEMGSVNAELQESISGVRRRRPSAGKTRISPPFGRQMRPTGTPISGGRFHRGSGPDPRGDGLCGFDAGNCSRRSWRCSGVGDSLARQSPLG